MLIHNHVISKLDYCNSIYYKLPNTLLKKLQNIQNRAARLIRKIPLRERITPALMELHWLPMKARIIYKICLLNYKALKFGEPKYLYEYLVPFELETSVTVRHASDRHRLFEPRTNRCSGERSFQYSAPRLYNKLPVEIKDNENISQFKKKTKNIFVWRILWYESENYKRAVQSVKISQTKSSKRPARARTISLIGGRQINHKSKSK